MYENSLIHEKSPYLLQHAHNPVNWYPWEEKAFQKAKDEKKPVFLSIGYSTCHWCHVMARESFEDEEMAAVLNRDFVAIKVDKEERPDIDAVYMAICQAMTGSGGWPLTILMTPEKKPFYAATYLPKKRRYGSVGLMELLPEVSRLWKKDREQLLQTADEIAAFAASRDEAAGAAPDKALLHGAVRLLRRGFDQKNGGFGPAPKFPTPHTLLFLMRYAALEQDENVLQMVRTTLNQMARGGIHDQIGGGFSRYSTDEKWLVPHFEKMLYDNALLAYAYMEAYCVMQYPFYKRTAVQTLGYALRELRSPQGGFYCGQDADSDGVEGKYYVFTPEEVNGILGQADGSLFCSWFDIKTAGNFDQKSIPHLLATPDYETPSPQIDTLCKALYAYRMGRTVLHRDDKILTAWNALMLAALAKAYRVIGDTQYLHAAQTVRQFIQTHLIGENGRLFVRWRDGQVAHMGQLDDYAFYAWALLELYAANFDISCLQEAAEVASQMEKLFFDASAGGFYLYASDAEQLLSRPKELYDGAMPSGNAAAAAVLVRLARLTGMPHWQALADKQLCFLAGNIADYPAGHTFTLLAMAEALYPAGELVCTLSGTALPDGLCAWLERNGVAALVKTAENEAALSAVAPFTASYPLPKQGEAYYFCKNGACSAPVFHLEEL